MWTWRRGWRFSPVVRHAAAAGLALVLTAAPAQADAWGPWAPAPAAEAAPSFERLATGDRAGAMPWLALLRAYQLLLSAQDVGSCPMHPSCSRFAMGAFAARDPLQAFLMTADRLIRDGAAAHPPYRWVRVGEQLRYADPPEERRPW